MAKNSPDGEMMRMIEYKIDYTKTLDVGMAKQMFDHQLMENYGHAGAMYASWLVRNREEAIRNVRGIQAKIDSELKLTQRERFWSSVAAANITGGLIAVKYLNLMDWDMQRIYKYATNMLLSLREDVRPPATDVATVIGDYLNQHISNILVVDDGVDLRSNMAKLPIVEPRGELLVRYEPDTQRMFVAAKSFKNYCAKYQISYKGTLEALHKTGAYMDAGNKRLSKGTKLPSLPTHCLWFDTSAGEFLNVGDILIPETARVETADAGGGS